MYAHIVLLTLLAGRLTITSVVPDYEHFIEAESDQHYKHHRTKGKPQHDEASKVHVHSFNPSHGPVAKSPSPKMISALNHEIEARKEPSSSHTSRLQTHFSLFSHLSAHRSPHHEKDPYEITITVKTTVEPQQTSHRADASPEPKTSKAGIPSPPPREHSQHGVSHPSVSPPSSSATHHDHSHHGLPSPFFPPPPSSPTHRKPSPSPHPKSSAAHPSHSASISNTIIVPVSPSSAHPSHPSSPGISIVPVKSSPSPAKASSETTKRNTPTTSSAKHSGSDGFIGTAK